MALLWLFLSLVVGFVIGWITCAMMGPRDTP